MTIPGIILREDNGAALTHAQVDNNFDAIRKFVEAQSARLDAILNPDGSLKDGAISDPDMFSDALIAQFFDLTFRLGDFISSGRTTAPTAKWLAMDGSAISRTTYADLFALFNETFGSGDGAATFNLPKAPGRAIIGAGTGSGLTARTLGQEVGAETHELAVAEGFFAHKHVVGADAGTDQVWMRYETGFTVSAFNGTRFDQIEGTSTRQNNSGNTAAFITTSEAVDQATTPVSAHANMQPSLVMNHWIKVLP